jgi:spore maturation protein CgeB
MNILFIGHCEYGSTSRMRYEMIQQYFSNPIDLINITPIIESTKQPFKSIGWRFRCGPLIKSINNFIRINYNRSILYDMIWVEKGVFIKEATLLELKRNAKKLVHFTPDPAFFYHRSRHFNNCLKYYDFCVTTKKFELKQYSIHGAKRVLLCTQGFDMNIHKPMVAFENKIYDICFIGHYELEREQILFQLINEGYSVALAGIKWDKFVKKNSHVSNLHYFGNHIAGKDYALLISQSKLGLGLISKWIPEKHTTRTFEIPACGTLLVTERNEETVDFFQDDQVIFFDDIKDISSKIAMVFNSQVVKQISDKGRNAVLLGGYSHEIIVKNILDEIMF